MHRRREAGDDPTVLDEDADLARRIVETIHEPLLVLDEDLHVRRASPSFYRTFGVAEKDVVHNSFFELGDGQWDVPELREQLRRVVQNLVENALTYRGDEAPVIRITGEETEGGAVHVVVRDRGPGIPPEHQEKVFGIFHQLDPHGEGREGSGMGLALCRKIVERHGGEIWVESEPGEGSAFHFTLTLSSEESP